MPCMIGKPLGQYHPLNGDETGIILDLLGYGDLPALVALLEHQRLQTTSCRIYCSSQTGRPSSDYDHIVMVVKCRVTTFVSSEIKKNHPITSLRTSFHVSKNFQNFRQIVFLGNGSHEGILTVVDDHLRNG